MLDGTLFQARGPLYLKDCLVIFNLYRQRGRVVKAPD